jgi:hypothetical protein
VRTNAPTADPMESANRMTKRKRICVLTSFSTAVRLIGVALRQPLSARSTRSRRDPRRIAHQLGMMAGEDDETIDPVRVPQLSTAQEKRFRREGNGLLNTARLQHKGAFIGVEGAVGLLGAEVAGEGGDGLGRSEFGGGGRGLLDLEVGLAVYTRATLDSRVRGQQHAPIQIARLDVAQAVGLARAEEDKIGRERVVALEADDVADLDMPPGLVDESAVDEHLGFARVELRIGLVPFLYANSSLMRSQQTKGRTMSSCTSLIAATKSTKLSGAMVVY